MNVLHVTQGLAEINHVHPGDLEITGGVVLLPGRITGDVIVHGGRLVVSGIIDGNLDNRGGAVRISGTVLGSITGSPAYTVMDIGPAESSDPFASWDPTPRPAKASARQPRPTRRNRLWASLTAGAFGVATIGAVAAVGDNTAIADSTTEDGAAIIQIVEKPEVEN